jgi:hypothetical protein
MQREIPSEGGSSSRFVAKPALLRLLTATALAVSVGSATAGTATYDFTTDPTTDPAIIIAGNNDAPYQPAGGNPGGFLALTYPQGSQSATVVFPDIDAGRLVKAFKFEADLRIGNSTGDRAADGFSVSFARNGDPILADPANASGFAGGGPAEFGTQTGIAVCFDTWSGNDLPDGRDFPDNGAIDDPGGIIVRVDNVTVLRQALPTYHGACTDINSLQTGPRDAAYWDTANGGLGEPRDPLSWATLCWQPFVIDLDETGKLTVIWKGNTILNKHQTTYFPSVGRLVLAGRTGGANEHTHFDNIKLTTIQADNPIIGTPAGDSCSFTVPIADAQGVGPNLSTIQVQLNGATVPFTTRRDATAGATFVDVVLATRLAPGSTNPVSVAFQTTATPAGNASAVRNYIVPAATTIPASAKAATFTATASGFLVRPHWQGDENGRGPGDVNSTENAETQLAGRFTDASGAVLPNQADLTGAVNGFLTHAGTVNFDQNAGDVGNTENFNTTKPEADPRPNEAFPGIAPANSSNFATEILTFLDLPAGCHTLGVNSDDGFLVTLGHSKYGTKLGEFNGGRGAADTLFRIVVEEAGVYPIRLSWWEGGGGANLEFFSMVGTNKILINDRAVTGHIKAYSAGTAPGVLTDFGIERASFGPNPSADLIATFRDGSSTVDDASIRLTVDGTSVTPVIANAGTTTTATFAPAGGWALGSSHTARLVYSIGGVSSTNDISFTVRLGGFFIEAEHFNHSGGQVVAAVNTMPYTGTEYDQLGAVHDTDYHQPGNVPDGDVYRIGETPNTPMGANLDGDAMRGDTMLTQNFSIGWGDDGDWYNYTRTFTNGNYYMFGGQNHGDPLGAPDRQRMRLSIMGAGGAETQVGSYSRPSSGGWGVNTINQIMNGPVPAVVTLGGTQTIRARLGSGDFDWFAFVPTTNAASTPNFIIEAEDFNHGGGQTQPAASTMPLTTAPYNTLGAVTEVDYHVIGDVTDAGSDFYRTNELPHVPINENNGFNSGDRGLFIRQTNFKIGWIDSGEWFNYTRTFPEGNYNVYAAISHGGGPADVTSGSLQLVTGGATTTTQTTQDLGTFNAPGATGGWGNNRLVPLQSGGSLATVALGGTQTVRYTAGSGDFDYLVFVKSGGTVTPPGLRITGITRTGNQLTITWTGGGTLEESATVGTGATWTAVAGAGAGTATVTVGTGNRFFRVRG